MPKCPNCEENITYLIYSYSEYGWRKIDKKGKESNWQIPMEEVEKIHNHESSNFNYEDIGESERLSYYKCSKCNTEIFEDYGEALKFLKGKK